MQGKLAAFPGARKFSEIRKKEVEFMGFM